MDITINNVTTYDIAHLIVAYLVETNQYAAGDDVPRVDLDDVLDDITQLARDII